MVVILIPNEIVACGVSLCRQCVSRYLGVMQLARIMTLAKGFPQGHRATIISDHTVAGGVAADEVRDDNFPRAIRTRCYCCTAAMRLTAITTTGAAMRQQYGMVHKRIK